MDRKMFGNGGVTDNEICPLAATNNETAAVVRLGCLNLLPLQKTSLVSPTNH